MIKFVVGDMFETKCDAIVNPCNCVGVGGKGISLYMKERAPANFLAFKEACATKKLYPGKCLINENSELSPNIKYIVNLPTKNDWRDPSHLEYIRDGVTDLVRMMRDFGIDSCAIPALGCGCGGLRWDDVKQTILDVLNYQGHHSLYFEIYEPK